MKFFKLADFDIKVESNVIALSFVFVEVLILNCDLVFKSKFTGYIRKSYYTQQQQTLYLINSPNLHTSLFNIWDITVSSRWLCSISEADLIGIGS